MEPKAANTPTTLKRTADPRGEAAPATGLVRGAQIGRYILLDHIGSGGMGTVYSAYDRELGRRVALKFLLPRVVADEARGVQLLREAQAMARLSHPNICAIHDVGIFDDQWFFAMELVDGETLRSWLRQPRRWREVLDVLVGVGRGIAAAHAVDVIHGDIKPENVMIAADGRARVMDFGVARAEPAAGEVEETLVAGSLDSTDELRLAGSGSHSHLRGTPSYMAPEQWKTRRSDAASDQFSFCVMAWEALLGARPFSEDEVASVDDVGLLRARAPASARAPAWLRRVLQRGLAGRPTDRFAGMERLAAALASGQGRRRRALAAVATSLLALGLGGVAGGVAWQEQQRVNACAADGASFAAEVWTPEVRRGVTERMGAWRLTEAAAVAERMAGRVDSLAERWRTARTDACLAGDDRRATCLEDQRTRVELLVASLPVETWPAASASIRAMAELSDPRSCDDPARRSASQRAASSALEEALRHDLLVADVNAATNRRAEARALVHSLIARADAAGLTALAIEATMIAGRLAQQAGEFELADLLLRHALIEAGSEGLDEVAADAAIELTRLTGISRAQYAEGLRTGEFAEMLVRRLDQAGRPRHARLLTMSAAVRMRTGDLRGALALAERAEGILRGELGEMHPDRILLLDLLAGVYRELGDYARAVESYESAIALAETLLGPDSVDAAFSLSNLGTLRSFQMEHAEALRLQRKAVGILERVLGPRHVDVARARENLAIALAYSGDPKGSVVEHAAAIAMFEAAMGPMHSDLATMLHDASYAHVMAGELATAEAQLRRAMRIWELTLAPDDPRQGMLMHALGDTLMLRGEVTEAVTMLERAVRVINASGQPERVADARVSLARAVWAVRGDRDEALSLAQQAAVAYRAAGPMRAESLAELDQWMRTLTATSSRRVTRPRSR